MHRTAGTGPDTSRPVGLSRRPATEIDLTPADAVRRCAHLRDAVVLAGRWECGEVVIAVDPIAVSRTGDPLAVLDRQPVLRGPAPGDAIGGGWFGWIGMEAQAHALGFYPNVLRCARGQWWDEALTGLLADDALETRRQALIGALAQGAPAPQPYTVGHITSSRDRAAHTAAVERCIHRIRDGEIYQANICLTLRAELDGSAAGLAADLLTRLQPSYGAYVGIGPQVVASASPELFLRRRGQAVTSRPIKGTRPRTGRADEIERSHLAGSGKDRAENVMIVDLVRNDLSRVARTGSVRVPRLLEVSAHPGVWHLISDVQAELPADATDGDLLRAAFPPGSVTGAPKHRALEVIAELEDGPRGVYTGAIGYASPAAGLELSVGIRTFSVEAGRLTLGVGGGITVDSTPAEEWWECFDKARPLLAAVSDRAPAPVPESERPPADPLAAGGVFDTSLRCDGAVLDVAEHRARLERSVYELYQRRLPPDAVRAYATTPGARGWERQRIDVTPDGSVTVTRTPAGPPEPITQQPGAEMVTVDPATGARFGADFGFGRHKWADRRRQEALEAAMDPTCPGCVVALTDTRGGLLETTRANVFGVQGDRLLTPPLDGRILPGVTRTLVLDVARELGLEIELRPPDPLRADALAVTGSVAGLRWIRRCDARTWPGPGELLTALSERLLAQRQQRATVPS